MPKIAVVILNYNGSDYLDKFLPALVQHSAEAELIVADNASTDNSLELLKSKYPSIRVIKMDQNTGFAGGYNLALRQVDAEYFVLLNSDVEVSPEWLSPMVSFLDENPTYAACQPKILDFNKRDHFEYAGACGGFLDRFGFPFCRGRIFDKIEVDENQYNDSIDISWASGACLMLRSKVFFEVGSFDEDFFAHMEEIDLCWRMQKSGHLIKSIPASTVYHVGGGTLSKSSPFKTYLNFRNGLNLLVKNLPFSSLIWKFPIRVFLDWIAVLKFLLAGGPKHGFAVLKAHLHVVLRIIRTMKKRNNPGTDITKPYSIVLRHFIRAQNKFSEL